MRRLQGRDAIFLYMETPTNHMHMAFAGVFDPATVPGGAPQPRDLCNRLRDLLDQRLHLFAPFRQRLVEVPFDLHHPVLVEDPDFDLDFHLRRAALPAPGGMRELEELVGEVAGRPMDRRHPLWELHVVEGLEGGRWALVAKAHHAIIDGVGGNEIMINLFDLAPEPRDVPPAEQQWGADPIPSDLGLIARAAAANLASPPRMLKAVARTAGTLGRVARERIGGQDEPAVATLGPRTILNRTVGPQRQASFVDVPFADVKQVKRALGVKVNDVVLALCGRALRRFLAANGDEPERCLVAAVPISVRAPDDTETGNRVAGMTVPLADDEDDPAEQLRRIKVVTATAKDRLGAITADLLRDWTEHATPALAVQAFRFYSRLGLARSHPPVANLTISNVPGPDFPLYVAGSRLEAMYPMGPVFHGQGLNITVVSYMGRLYFGMVADRDTVPALGGLAEEIPKALSELVEAAENA